MTMHDNESLPRILIIDDLYGRSVASGMNKDRQRLCSIFHLLDLSASSDDERGDVQNPIAAAHFHRGQKVSGDCVENDLEGVVDCVRRLWNPEDGLPRISMVLLDLCFYTGRITAASQRDYGEGMPKGRSGDIVPSEYFGLRVLQELKMLFRDLPIVMFSGNDPVTVSMDYSRRGASGFVERKNGAEDLRKLLHRYGWLSVNDGIIVGKSKPLLEALNAARMAASADPIEPGMDNILLQGETGTGKELFAKYIHDNNPRRKSKPFIAVNCKAIGDALFESELFGHVKGAFTGAIEEKKGQFELAEGGTIFLDEMDKLSYDNQEKLLRVLSSREIRKVGGEATLKIDCTCIAAGSGIFLELVKLGKFSNDLYHRLKANRVVLPALRNRKDDIPLIANSYLAAILEKRPDMKTSGILDETYEALKAYEWPGNVRELMHVIQNAIRKSFDVEYVAKIHLPDEFQACHAASREGMLAAPGKKPGACSAATVEDVLTAMENCEIDFESIKGLYPKLQSAYAVLLGRTLEAAVAGTVEPVTGETQITPAMKILMGESSLSTPKAADEIKRIQRISPRIIEILRIDYPHLDKALAAANKIRPSSK